jgi:hypothetical protein
MSESISALDGDYVRLGRVAALVAQERQQCAADDVMDLFKRALFAGEFDGTAGGLPCPNYRQPLTGRDID